MGQNRKQRRQAGLRAGRILSYLLKCIVIVSAVYGTVMSARAGNRSFMGGSRVFMYFTIQSNLAAALICLIDGMLMAGKKPVREGWSVVVFMGAVSITLTGIVFSFVLAPTFGPAIWSLPNVLTHVVVPAAMVADFLVTGIRRPLGKRAVLYGLLPPLAYAVYAGIGYVQGWEFANGIHYPYFFLNWGSPAGAFGFSRELPLMGCVWWILAILVFLLFVGWLYLTLLGLLKKLAGKLQQGEKDEAEGTA